MSCILLAGLYSTRINFCCLPWLTSSPELLGDVMELLGGSWSLDRALQLLIVPVIILLFCLWSKGKLLFLEGSEPRAGLREAAGGREEEKGGTEGL